jgi:hypothetical protein
MGFSGHMCTTKQDHTQDYTQDLTTPTTIKQDVMHFCENCGATKGGPAIGCPAFFSRGPHAFVVGNNGMACTYCDSHPGGLGTRCSGRMAGGSHDFQDTVTMHLHTHTRGGKTKLLAIH